MANGRPPHSNPSRDILDGVHVALATPFNSKGDVCFASLEKLLGAQVQAGVDGFVPLGTTGESPTLGSEERTAILKTCVQVAKQHGRKVIAGCGSNDTRHAVEYARQARDLGCDAALIITPYYNKPTQAGLVQHFLKIADEADFPIVLYHSQGRSGVSLSMETFRRLFEHPRIVGVKEASGNHAGWLALGEEFAQRKTLLAGDDDMFASFLAMGACGIISASCNVIPKPFVRMWKAAQAGDLATAFALQIQILPMVRALFAETNPSPVKYALWKQGICENTLRLPLVPVSASTEAMLATALQRMQEQDLL